MFARLSDRPGWRWFVFGLVLAVAAVAVGALVLSAFRGTGREPTLADLVAGSDPGPIHVHGLGVNPADETLFIATHTGMFSVSTGETKAQRVTDRYQDTMGFTVIGKNRFLGSGHPDPSEAREKGLPPLLGLIESRDAGRSWRPISLLGEADFHVLRSAGNLVYGYDATNERLLLSRNAGRTWLSRTAQAPLIDLVVDPGRPAHVIASAQAVLFESFDGGARWKVNGTQTGLLAWPALDELFIVQGSGDVLTSRDSGRRWLRRGSIGGEPAAVLGRAANDLYVALHDGTIKRSIDGGRTWSVRSRP
jgi:hypothetical protein